MADLGLYVGLAAFGYLLTVKFLKRKDLGLVSMLQSWAILLLVFSMGARMGANDEIIGNLNRIGLYAFLMTIVTVSFSVAAVWCMRRLLRLDRYGRAAVQKEELQDGEPQQEKGLDGGTMTFLIVLTVGLGMFFGYLLIQKDLAQYEEFDAFAGFIIKIGLCFLLFLVGVDLGREGTFVEDIKRAGFRILLIPAAVCIGTLTGAAVCSLFLPLTLGQSMAVGAGFGWYSLAPVMIMEKGFLTASAVSFMHNVMRELISLLLIPTVARRAGYIEAAAMPGSGASDVCLPLIVKSTRGGIAIYSFVTGISVSILVPLLVPLFL